MMLRSWNASAAYAARGAPTPIDSGTGSGGTMPPPTEDGSDLSEYRNLAPHWQDWANVQSTCIRIAVAAFDAASGGAEFEGPS